MNRERIVEEIKARAELLKTAIRRMNSSPMKVEGSIYCLRYRGADRYFQGAAGKRTYIRAGDTGKISLLCRKRYQVLLRKAAERELSCLMKCLDILGRKGVVWFDGVYS